jgi:hypothetical protein
VVIANNTAISHGGVDCAAGAAVFDHVTVVGNDPGGLYFDTNGYARIINSIVAFNSDFGVRVQGNSFEPTTIAIGYSDLNDPVQRIGYASVDSLGGIIDADPLFVDLNNNDFHLLPGSPCIDAGDPAYPYDPDSTVTDMGAFYFHHVTKVNESPVLPGRIVMSQNYPNPFNAQTSISYVVPYESHVTIEIFDLLGRRVETLIDRNEKPGEHSVTWNAEDIASGLYLYRIKAGEFESTKWMSLIK